MREAAGLGFTHPSVGMARGRNGELCEWKFLKTEWCWEAAKH